MTWKYYFLRVTVMPLERRFLVQIQYIFRTGD